MRENISTISGREGYGGGDADAPYSPSSTKLKPVVSSLDQKRLQKQQPEKENDYSLNYGNYGDPYSFLPYQIILLLVDFIFNWTMDLVHEHPLAVLVIFVFQSLAVIINLILYIMASASQAMQVGFKKRVNIHHWINLCVCLAYMILTGWWFIWALRKSWPSVSDQFSFTWRTGNGSSLLANNGSASGIRESQGNKGESRVNASGQGHHPSAEYDDEMKEHYTLWSSGFNSLYVIQRSLAMIYYFIYLRATFLVLNTPKIDKFLEMKREYRRKINEAMNTRSNEKRQPQPRRRKVTSRKFDSFPAPSQMQLGLNEYLNGNVGFSLESEDPTKPGSGRKSSKKKHASVLWADDERKGREEKVKDSDGDGRKDFENRLEYLDDDSKVPTKESKKRKGKSKKKDTSDDDGGRGGYFMNAVEDSDREDMKATKPNAEDEDVDESDDIPEPPRPKPRPRSSHPPVKKVRQKRKDTKSSKDDVDIFDEDN